VRDESSASNGDVTVIPSQFQVTKQILLHHQVGIPSGTLS
jgi:hypothetical protein